MTSCESKTGRLYLPIVVLVAATLVCLLPFAGKAFNIDEPLFIWAAHQIQAHPLDFYGFHLNWYGSQASAAEIIKNPPLASYFLALAAAVGGWSELSLHLAFLLPALAAVLGTYFLARELTQAPLTATLIGTLSPVFIVSSCTVMCDTMMLAGYVWAVFLWLRGWKGGGTASLLAASLLIALCSLTKYFGMTLIPLLLAYSLLSGERGARQRVLFLLIPVVILGCYQWGTLSLYGRGLLSDAASYATAVKGREGSLLSKLLSGLSFSGGCLLPTLLFAPRLWGRRTLTAMAGLLPLVALVLARLELPPPPPGAQWGYFLQLALFVGAGLHLWALFCRDLARNRDPVSLLLFLWWSGTFFFASLVNWSVNGRSVLPMVPVVGIVIVRALAAREGVGKAAPDCRPVLTALVLCAAWLLSMSVAWADYGLAQSARQAAEVVGRNYGKKSLSLTFQGHWGFQYYLEQVGGVPLDLDKPLPLTRMIMVVPENNTNITPEVMKSAFFLPPLEFAPSRFLATMDKGNGAAFYSSSRGALPFAFGEVQKERYAVAFWQ